MTASVWKSQYPEVKNGLEFKKHEWKIKEAWETKMTLTLSHLRKKYHPSAPAPSILYPALNLDRRFISNMILYMFQCHPPKSSHPRPLPQSPKDQSIHLCLFCCLAYRVIVTIFLNTYLKCFSSEFCFFQVVKSFLLQFVWDYLT